MDCRIYGEGRKDQLINMILQNFQLDTVPGTDDTLSATSGLTNDMAPQTEVTQRPSHEAAHLLDLEDAVTPVC